jgi:hypothetical protein
VSTGAIPSLSLTVSATGEQIHLTQPQVIVAGYTGRDGKAVQAHIDELARIGIKPPPHVPMFYALDSRVLTVDRAVAVAGARTSGEVEPVLVLSDGRVYLGVGSDHTDRELETRSIADAKAAAPKPIGSSVVPMTTVQGRWDEIAVACRLDGSPYQDGRLSALTTPERLLDKLAMTGVDLTGDAVIFCGTLPLLTGEFVYGSVYELEMRLPDGTTLSHSYTVTTAATGRETPRSPTCA